MLDGVFEKKMKPLTLDLIEPMQKEKNWVKK
jgi:hypothetical protein